MDGLHLLKYTGLYVRLCKDLCGRQSSCYCYCVFGGILDCVLSLCILNVESHSKFTSLNHGAHKIC